MELGGPLRLEPVVLPPTTTTFGRRFPYLGGDQATCRQSIERRVDRPGRNTASGPLFDRWAEAEDPEPWSRLALLIVGVGIPLLACWPWRIVELSSRGRAGASW